VTKTKWVSIDLEDLYKLGHIKIAAARLLDEILRTYNVEYELLVNCSPDIGDEFLVDDKDFIEKFKNALGWQEMKKVLKDYAKRRNAKAIVELFDGYESAYALIF